MKIRKGLEAISNKGYHRLQRVNNTLILLSGDAEEHQIKYSKCEDIARVLNISTKKIERVKKQFVEEGFDVAVDGHKSKHIYEKKADGAFEAHLIAMSCGKPPKGHCRWSLRLLAEKAVELEYIDTVSQETVREALKNEIKPWEKKCWVIPPEHNAAFVAHMENVLDIYKRPYNCAFLWFVWMNRHGS